MSGRQLADLKATPSMPDLVDFLFRLGQRVGPIEKECHNLFEHFCSYIHSAVDAIAWLGPIHFAGCDPGHHSLSAIAKLRKSPLRTTVRRL